MFTDERTNTTIHANLDETVIHATLRPQDLIPAFLDVIKDTVEYEQLMVNNAGVPSYAASDNDSEWWDSEDCSFFLNESLFNTLEQYAPDGFYFGNTEGNGSDFGFWKNNDEFEMGDSIFIK